MKTKEIIEALLSHEISKHEALEKLNEITDGLRKKKPLEFIVESVGFTSVHNDGYLKIRLPFKYSEIQGKIKKGDYVDVTILP